MMKIFNYKKTENKSDRLINSGFSLIEILIAVTLFAIISVVSTLSLFTSMRNSRKSQSITTTRENVDHVVSSMERLLRNAQDLTCVSPSHLRYLDEYSNTTDFRCIGTVGNRYIASGSANIRMTSPEVDIICSDGVFTCNEPLNAPESVDIVVKGIDTLTSGGTEGSEVVSQTKVLLRVYPL